MALSHFLYLLYDIILRFVTVSFITGMVIGFCVYFDQTAYERAVLSWSTQITIPLTPCSSGGLNSLSKCRKFTATSGVSDRVHVYEPCI